MRCSQRLMTFAVLISLCGVLAGCGGGGFSNWDPTDLLGFLDTKKKIKGNRQPVFPEGVPGIEQGVPKDLYKSNAEPQQAQEPVAAPSPDESGRARRSGKVDGSEDAEASAADAGTAAAAPRKPKRFVHRRATSLPKEEPSSRQQATPPPPPAAQQSEPAASPFPAPLPSGSFAR
ncbi:hypothetical protein NB311A_02316 [Nitrobacter sp. Nb-311A]|uniref:hypothetical protein n=1 Tax=unclassified Nitrobacter TaxID=2620411 RepID=UPI000068755B|nr:MULTISPECIES: hypothetical protein [unclassified Nitrobacter]EAQ34633.1 hypothetical protein NB311A_02316 [Nitrobacter sp. Nb-311A]MCB1391803.1 hypothetical protein [Nitrobacter sp.]MCV0386991.1 hypothetical protein [Nitrobacter sp.]